jgi:HPt (histidine-containing phosphotransfer) domain-containing protein
VKGIPEEAREPLAMISAVAGDALVLQLFETFVRHAEERLVSADAAVAAGDAREIARVAHGLMASARQLGAMPLADACARAEALHAGGLAPERARDSLADIRREFEIARRWMREAAQND